MADYQAFKNSVIGQGIVTVQGRTNPFDVQCVTLAWAYANFLFPDVNIGKSISTGDARTVFDNASSQFWTKIANDPNDPNQNPIQGDVMVFSETPYAGYTNKYNNPYGHIGLCDGIDATGYFLLHQNAPSDGQSVNVTRYSWKFRHCIGWLRPKDLTPAPIPAPTPVPAPLPEPVVVPVPEPVITPTPAPEPVVEPVVTLPAITVTSISTGTKSVTINSAKPLKGVINMKQVNSFVKFLSGKKTHVVAVGMFVLNIAVALNLIDPAHLAQINMVLGSLGLSALRMGVASKK